MKIQRDNTVEKIHFVLAVLSYAFTQKPNTVISREPFTPSERRAVLSLASLYSFRMLGLFMVLPLIAVYAADLPGATPATLGLALGGYGLTQACLQVPMGWLSDRLGRKPIVLAGLAIFIAGSVVAAMAETMTGLILGRLLQGGGAIAAALMALAADYTRDDQRTKAMAVIGASIGASFIIALVLGPSLAALGGLSLVFWVTAGLGACGVLLVVLVLPPVTRSAQGAAGHGLKVSELRAAIHGRGLPTLYASVFLLHLMLMAAFVAVPARLATTIGLPADHHWVVYLAAVLLSLPGVMLLLRGKRRSGNNPRFILVVALLLIAIGLLAAVGWPNLWGVGIGLAVFFTGFNTMEASLPALVSQLAPSEFRGTAMGLFSTSQFLGAFVGGSVGGLALQWGGVSALAGMLSLLALIWLPLVLRWQMAPSETSKNDQTLSPS